MMNKTRLIAATLIACAACAASAQSLDTPWLVRVRATQLQSANSDNTGLGLSVNDKTIPEVDISYFFSKNFATELVLTVPQKHTLYSNGSTIGSLKHLPPTVLFQYHFDGETMRPYVGAGVNFTFFSELEAPPGVDIRNNSTGAALQIGVDFPLSRTSVFNLDVKKINIATDVSAGGTKLGTFKVDPTLLSVGFGWRF